MDNLEEEGIKRVDQSNTSTQIPKVEGFWATVDEFGPIETASNYVLFFVCIATVVSDSIAIYVVNRGRNFPRFCRVLSINYLISDLTGAAIFALHQLLIFACGYSYEIVLMSRITFTAIPILISSASLSLISLERVMALVGNLRHTVDFGAMQIACLIFAIWLFNAGLVFMSVLLKLGIDCHWGLSNCYLFDELKLSRYVTLSMLLIYDMILIVTNIIIQSFVRRHVTQIIKQQSSVLQGRPLTNSSNSNQLSHQEYEVWKTVAKILMSYFVLHIPMSVSLFIHEWYGDMRNEPQLRILRIACFLCLQISSFVHLYLYVFKLKENKLNMYVLLSHMFKRYKPRAEQLRLSVYNIPVVASTDRTRIPLTNISSVF